jgi:ATP-binding cassette subfamily B protein
LIIVQGLLPGSIVYLSKLTIDSFVQLGGAAAQAAAYERAVLLIVLTAVCLLLDEVLRYLAEFVRTAQAEYFADHIKGLIHAKSAEIDIACYESPEYHDLLEQVRGEAQSKPLAVLENLGAVVQSGVTLVIFGTILLSYGWVMPLMLIATSLPGLFFSLKYDRIYHSWWKGAAQKRRWLAYFEAVLTHPSAAAEMRLFGLGRYFQKKYSGMRQDLRQERVGHLKRQYFAKVFTGVFSLLGAAAAIGWIAQRALYGLATVGDIVVFYNIFTRGQGLMRSLLSGFGQTVNNGLYVTSIFSFLDLEIGIKSPSEPLPFPKRIEQGISFRNVTFSYPGEERKAIRNLDLYLPAEKLVAIVGVNGAGKSTLIKLLSRFYDVQDGTIEIDGIDIRKFDLDDLRQNISVLFQFPVQFHESAADNIALGLEEVSSRGNEIEKAAMRAGAHEFIKELPDGYATLLGKWFVKGTELSGGQWQRIALARAYFRNSQIVVLDEPTSFMDPWSETDWFDRFRGLSARRCGVIITHRFTIARRADLIYVIDDGQVREQGTHEELIRLNGFYAESWHDQQKGQSVVASSSNESDVGRPEEHEGLKIVISAS